jgi:hypothetical protein
MLCKTFGNCDRCQKKLLQQNRETEILLLGWCFMFRSSCCVPVWCVIDIIAVVYKEFLTRFNSTDGSDTFDNSKLSKDKHSRGTYREHRPGGGGD